MESMAFFPVEDIINLQEDYAGRTWLEYYIDRMKEQIIHAIHKETFDPKKLKDKLNVLVEIVPENDPDKEFREYIEKVLKEKLRNMKVVIRTKNGLEEVRI